MKILHNHYIELARRYYRVHCHQCHKPIHRDHLHHHVCHHGCGASFLDNIPLHILRDLGRTLFLVRFAIVMTAAFGLLGFGHGSYYYSASILSSETVAAGPQAAFNPTLLLFLLGALSAAIGILSWIERRRFEAKHYRYNTSVPILTKADLKSRPQDKKTKEVKLST